MRTLIAPILFLILLIPQPSHSDYRTDWSRNVHEVILPNGMKFLLYPRGEAPIFSAYVRFRAGGMDEESGKTGLAHFLEHMAFKGTKSLGTRDFAKEKPILDEIEKVGEQLSAEYRKGRKADPKKIRELREKLRSLHEEEKKYLVPEEVARAVLENGGEGQNATTSKDVTSYFVSMPSEKLAFWAKIESERIFEPVFREFYEEKDVVLEERRMRVDNDPDGRLYEAFLETAFPGNPYGWPTIGYEQDLLGLSLKDLKCFWENHYQPSNAVGVLVGKLDIEKTKKILRTTFGNAQVVPSGSCGTRLDQSFLKEAQTGPRSLQELPGHSREKKITIHYKARPRLLIGYHKPTLPSREDYLFDLLDQILGGGRSSRLYRKLILEKKIVSSVDTSSAIPGSRHHNLFMIAVEPLDNHTPEEILKVIDEELETIKEEGVTAEDLKNAVNRLTVDRVWGLKTNEGLASQLSYFEIVAGSWKYLEDYLQKISSFQPSDVQQLAKDYFTNSNRTVATLKP